MALSNDNLRQILTTRELPTITMFNRLEGRPRTRTFDRALRAEVRDALWMLTRQWQLGELTGDDAGSPLGAQLEIAAVHLDHTTIGAATMPYSDDQPLEATVECQPIALVRGTSKIQLDLRAQLGRQWTKLLAKASLGGYHSAYLASYPFALPPDDLSDAAADVYAHVEARQLVSALTGRAIDGGDLYAYLIDPAHKASDGIVLAAPGDGPALDALGQRLVAWFQSLYLQPGGESAWQPSSLDHAFSCSAAGSKNLVADEYPGGHLDWYSFDITGPGPARVPPTVTKSLLPAPLVFDGMPNTRWWKFEDSKVSFGDISPATTDIAKLLMIEFALVYANDWFLVPFSLAAGSLANIHSMVVTNSFNERFWIDAAGTGAATNWHQWRMFELAPRGSAKADTTMFLAPAVPKIQNGDPLEEVYFVRDEMADLVWGIENLVPLVSGASRPGSQVGRETATYHRPAKPAASAPYAAAIYYESMTEVPEHWIPFIPVHVASSNREIQLQRGGMQRRIDGQPLAKIEAQTMTLRPGVDTKPTRLPYYIHEERVPRAGVRVTRAFNRTRWRGGRVFTWLAMAVETGRGEDRSGLAFDQIPSSR